MLVSGDCFTGIGGFTLGLQQAGIETGWQIEIDPKRRAILNRHWPGVPKGVDVRDAFSVISPVNIIVGGFPCQDLSYANQDREGLAGERSGLFYAFMGVVDKVLPEWIIIENVLGLLSSHGGRDFAEVLKNLASSGYGVAWRVFDAQYFGLAQRRRRVVIVGNRRDWSAPARVLFEPESVRRNSKPGRQTWEETSRGLQVCPNCGGVHEEQIVYVDDVSRAITGKGSKFSSGQHNQGTLIVSKAVAFDVRNLREHREGISGPLQSKAGHGGYSHNFINPIVQQNIKLCDCPGPKIYQWASEIDPNLIKFDTPVIRKPTPKECERLQGFPDDHTAWGVLDDGRNKKIANTVRYTFLGDAVPVPLVKWVGERIVKISEGNL